MSRATESAALPWLRHLGVDTPELAVVADESGLASLEPTFGPPWVVKPDIAGSGKGLAGLVHICRTEEALRSAVGATLAGGAPAVVDEFVEGSECYVSISLDESSRAAIVRASATGGVGFDPREAASVIVGLTHGLDGQILAELLDAAAIEDAGLHAALAKVLPILWQAFCDSEAVLIEVNPFRWDGRRLVAVGVAVEFDPHGHPDAAALRPSSLVDPSSSLGREPTERELAVRAADDAEPSRPGIKFFELDGDVAYLISGGGAGLLGLDYLVDIGARPACYLDSSPGAGMAKLRALFGAGLSVPGIKGVLFGAAVLSLVDARGVAEGLIAAAEHVGFDSQSVPTVIRLAGPYEVEARDMLTRALPGALVLDRRASIEDACDLLVSAMAQAAQELEGAVRR